jgi:Ala-tRNA(Pro) deacylase
MGITKRLRELLDEHGVDYEVMAHDTAFTAQEEAAATHVKGRNWAKTVAVRVEGEPALVVLPATRRVDLERLGEVTGSSGVELIAEDEMEELYPDCELGAMPPFGHLYGQRTFVDETLREDEFIVFHAGDHETAVRIAYGAYEELEDPVPALFSEPAES